MAVRAKSFLNNYKQFDKVSSALHCLKVVSYGYREIQLDLADIYRVGFDSILNVYRLYDRCVMYWRVAMSDVGKENTISMLNIPIRLNVCFVNSKNYARQTRVWGGF